MPARILLYLTASKMVAYRWQADSLIEDAAFDAAAAGGEFIAYLQRRPRHLVSVLANVAEEGFQVDSIPYLRAKDRRTVVNRKLGQLFLGAPLATAISLGYEKTRRKDERLLFAALTNKGNFEPWLNALQATEARLEGVHSVPLVIPRLLERLQIQKQRLLLLTAQDTTIRQSFFTAGHLQFSRVSPLANSSIVGLAQAIAGETAKTQQYLLSQRLIARNEPLTVGVIAHPQAMPALRAACAGNDTLRYEFHDLVDLARKLGLKTAPADSRAEALFLHTLAIAPPKQQFAGEPLRQEFRLWQLAKGLRAAAAAIGVGAVLYAGTLALEVVDLRRQSSTLRETAAAADRNYQIIARSFPQISLSNDALRQITNRYAALAEMSVSPARMYGEIGRTLRDVPQVEIDAIEWKLATPADAGGKPTPSTNAAPAAAFAALSHETATVHGTIRLDRKANPREVLRVFDGVVARLKANPELVVKINRQPFDVGSGASLKSGDDAADGAGPRPFSLSITRKLGA